jgi:YfiH family protein
LSVEFLTSDILFPARHGFFTRRGGASSGIFEGLNCGTGSSDQSDMVDINRGRVARAMGVAGAQLVTVHQVHSPDVVHITGPHDGPPPRADGMVTATPGVLLGILTADCQPVLFADAQAGVIGAAHAGWKGAAAGVLEATVAAMEALGARRDRIAAAIGPTISQPNYEVGPEFRETVGADPLATPHFRPGIDDRFQFDLPGYGLDLLRQAGVGSVAWIGECTYQDPTRYYSYRRSTHRGEADYGRLISGIRL